MKSKSSKKGNILVELLTICLHRVFKKSPKLWLLILSVLSISISVPLVLLTPEGNANTLYRETSGYMAQTYNRIEKLFPMNISTEFDESRLLNFLQFARILIRAKDGKSVLRPSIFKEIELIDKLVRNITIHSGNLEWRYTNLCAKKQGECLNNPLLSVGRKGSSIENGLHKVKFPFSVNMVTFEFLFLGLAFGDVETDDKENMKSANIGALMYVLDSDNPKFIEINAKWELELEKILTNDSLFSEIKIDFLTQERLKSGYNETILFSSFYLGIAIAVCFLCIVFLRVVNGKKCIALLLNTLVPVLSGVTATGLVVFAFSFPYTLLNFGSIVVMLVISSLDVSLFEKAMEKKGDGGSEKIFRSIGPNLLCTTFSLSTLWSLGLLTPIPLIGIVSLSWTLHAIIYYIYQIAFFTFWISDMQSGLNKEMINANQDESNDILRISKIGIIVYIVIVWLGYLVISCWSLKFLHFRMETDYFYEKTSDVYRVSKLENEYFSKYLYRTHVLFDEPLDYSDKNVQKEVDTLINAHPLTANSPLNESWLKFYLMFLKDPRSRLFTLKYDTSSSQGFIDCLRNVFFKIPNAKRFIKDVVFNANYTQITSSRVFIHAMGINNTEQGLNLISDLHKITENAPFKTRFVNIIFPIFDVINQIFSWWIIYAIVTSVLIGLNVFIFSCKISYAIIIGLAISGWQVSYLSSFVYFNMDFNTPTLISIILFSGLGMKFIIFSIPIIKLDFSLLVSVIQTISSLLLGCASLYAFKGAIYISDYLLIQVTATIFLYFTFLIVPFVYVFKHDTILFTLKFPVLAEEKNFIKNGFLKCPTNSPA